MHEFIARISRHAQKSIPEAMWTPCSYLAKAEILTTPVLGVTGRLISLLERCSKGHKMDEIQRKTRPNRMSIITITIRALPPRQSRRL